MVRLFAEVLHDGFTDITQPGTDSAPTFLQGNVTPASLYQIPSHSTRHAGVLQGWIELGEHYDSALGRCI